MLFKFQYHLYCNAVLYHIYHAAPLQFTVQATQLAKSVSLLSRSEFLLCPLLKYGYIGATYCKKTSNLLHLFLQYHQMEHHTIIALAQQLAKPSTGSQISMRLEIFPQT